jgi:hypothetical protein
LMPPCHLADPDVVVMLHSVGLVELLPSSHNTNTATCIQSRHPVVRAMI